LDGRVARGRPTPRHEPHLADAAQLIPQAQQQQLDVRALQERARDLHEPVDGVDEARRRGGEAGAQEVGESLLELGDDSGRQHGAGAYDKSR